MACNRHTMLVLLVWQYKHVTSRRGDRTALIDIVSFLEVQAKIATDPVFGNLFDVPATHLTAKGSDGGRRSPHPRAKGSSFGTTVSDAESKNQTGAQDHHSTVMILICSAKVDTHWSHVLCLIRNLIMRRFHFLKGMASVLAVCVLGTSATNAENAFHVKSVVSICGLNDYRPVALTSVVMKSFERLVLSYLKTLAAPLLDPLQFAYRANRSVDDAINMALHFILQHLDYPGTYARILFVDFSSAFNTILPDHLQGKLSQMNVPDPICRWITDFLTDRKQHMRLGKKVSDSRTISTGSPQGCVLSPLLFSLYTNCCTSTHQSVKLIKFADDTTVIGLISDGDESAYRREVERLVSWCSHNNLVLNAQKTVEIIVDFRKHTAPLPPIILTDTLITTVDSFRFLGTTITQDLKWEPTITSFIKKAQQRMYFLRQLKKFNLPTRTMMQFYTAIIESILTSSITVWYAGPTIRDKQRLQRVVRSAEKVIGCRLPSLQDLYTSRTLGCAARITADPSHPGHSLFDLLPSGRRLRSIRTRTSRHKNSFFPSAVGLMSNNHMTVPTTNT
uniref:Reverse transcriptase domain-containing protein n=1 Tax=Oreochromis niloticus TaxID=8128 RepID=A0A669CKQ3_ORENI